MAVESTQWAQAVDSLNLSGVRPELIMEEVPPPSRLAPYSIAMAVDAVSPADEDLATGRFVVLHDPDGQPAWDGTFRIVTFVKAAMEPDVVTDDMFDDVAWAWLGDSLSDCDATNLSGTVTRTVSRAFAGLEDRSLQTDLEIRASWTSQSSDVGKHLAAWLALVEMCAGMAPLPEGVAALPRSRS